MSMVIGVLGCAALFVIFGLVGGGHEKHEVRGACDNSKDTAKCGDCQTVCEISEQSHA